MVIFSHINWVRRLLDIPDGLGQFNAVLAPLRLQRFPLIHPSWHRLIIQVLYVSYFFGLELLLNPQIIMAGRPVTLEKSRGWPWAFKRWWLTSLLCILLVHI